MAIFTIIAAVAGGALVSQAKPVAKNLLFRYVSANKETIFSALNPRIGAWMQELNYDNYRSEVFELLYLTVPALENQPQWVKNAIFDTIEDAFLPSAGLRSMERHGVETVKVVQMISEDKPNPRTLKNLGETRNVSDL